MSVDWQKIAENNAMGYEAAEARVKQLEDACVEILDACAFGLRNSASKYDASAGLIKVQSIVRRSAFPPAAAPVPEDPQQ